MWVRVGGGDVKGEDEGEGAGGESCAVVGFAHTHATTHRTTPLTSVTNHCSSHYSPHLRQLLLLLGRVDGHAHVTDGHVPPLVFPQLATSAQATGVAVQRARPGEASHLPGGGVGRVEWVGWCGGVIIDATDMQRPASLSNHVTGELEPNSKGVISLLPSFPSIQRQPQPH